jgi:hypothetical protein
VQGGHILSVGGDGVVIGPKTSATGMMYNAKKKKKKNAMFW